MWILVDKLKPIVNVRYMLVGTGWDLIDDMNCFRYCNTIISKTGEVWHLYQEAWS